MQIKKQKTKLMLTFTLAILVTLTLVFSLVKCDEDPTLPDPTTTTTSTALPTSLCGMSEIELQTSCYCTADGVTDDSANLQTMITKIGEKQGIIIVDGGPGDNSGTNNGNVIYIANDITIPENIQLSFRPNCRLHIANHKVLKIHRTPIAPKWQIFGGSLPGTYKGDPIGGNDGSVEFVTPGYIDEVYPEWFGAKADGIVDCTVAIKKAVHSVSPICEDWRGDKMKSSYITGITVWSAMRFGGTVKLSKGIYKITYTILLNSHVKLIGDGGAHHNHLSLDENTATSTIIKFAPTSNLAKVAIDAIAFYHEDQSSGEEAGDRIGQTFSATNPVNKYVPEYYNSVNGAMFLSNVAIENLVLYCDSVAPDPRIGIRVLRSYNTSIEKVTVIGQGNGGKQFKTAILVGLDWGSGHIRQCNTYSSHQGIVLWESVNGFKVENCYINRVINDATVTENIDFANDALREITRDHFPNLTTGVATYNAHSVHFDTVITEEWERGYKIEYKSTVTITNAYLESIYRYMFYIDQSTFSIKDAWAHGGLIEGVNYSEGVYLRYLWQEHNTIDGFSYAGDSLVPYKRFLAPLAADDPLNNQQWINHPNMNVPVVSCKSVKITPDDQFSKRITLEDYTVIPDEINIYVDSSITLNGCIPDPNSTPPVICPAFDNGDDRRWGFTEYMPLHSLHEAVKRCPKNKKCKINLKSGTDYNSRKYLDINNQTVYENIKFEDLTNVELTTYNSGTANITINTEYDFDSMTTNNIVYGFGIGNSNVTFENINISFTSGSYTGNYASSRRGIFYIWGNSKLTFDDVIFNTIENIAVIQPESFESGLVEIYAKDNTIFYPPYQDPVVPPYKKSWLGLSTQDYNGTLKIIDYMDSSVIRHGRFERSYDGASFTVISSQLDD